MFERFSDRSRRVVVLAQEQARLLNHNYIGTEHLLLGLLHANVDDTPVAEVLHRHGLHLDSVQALVVDIIGSGAMSPSGHIPFTPRAKRALERSLREALSLEDNHIGPKHLALALFSINEGVAADIVVRAGTSLAALRAALFELGTAAAPSPAAAPAAEPATEADAPLDVASELQRIRRAETLLVFQLVERYGETAAAAVREAVDGAGPLLVGLLSTDLLDIAVASYDSASGSFEDHLYVTARTLIDR